MNPPRTIFFGSPEFAVPCLDALSEVSNIQLVVTQPDRPAGRGLGLRPPAVKVRALELGLPVLQPTKVRTAAFAETLRAVSADVAVVVAYGRILPRAVLDAPRLGCLNVHASLLPRWRGAAPINWSIVAGDTRSGVTLMQMDEGMDTGDALATREVPIGPAMTAGELSETLSLLGGALICEELPRFLVGALSPAPQDESAASHASLLSREHGVVAWGKSALEVHNHIRGFVPWPGAYTSLGGVRLKLHRGRVDVAAGEFASPGSVLRADARGIKVACGQGVIVIEELQLQGRKRMAVEAFLSGRPVGVGEHLG